MTHENARALLPRYVVGALDLGSAADLRHHIAAGCGECLQGLFATRRSARRGRRRAVDRVARVAVAAMICVAVMASVWTVAGGRDSPPSATAPTVPAAVVSDRADAVAKAVPRDASPVNVAPAREVSLPDLAPAPQEKPLISVRYSRGKLSVRTVNAPLGDVLREIGRQSGVTVHARIGDTRTVSLAFEDVPFEEALPQVLGHNFLLTYEGSRPRTLEVLEMPRASARVATPPNQEPPAATPPPAESTAAVPDERPAVALSDTLTAALGTSTMSLRQLLDVGINHADPAIRSRAVREAVAALQADADLGRPDRGG